MENYRIHSAASVYFITCSVVEWLLVFVSGDAISIVTGSLCYCHNKKGLRINACVVMPAHLHAIVFDRPHSPETLSRTLAAFRQFTGRALADFCAEQMPPMLSRIFEAAAGAGRRRRFRQPTRHPITLECESRWEQKMNYLHPNPCRKGLALYPEDWRYSSARFYVQGEDRRGDVPITPLDWH